MFCPNCGKPCDEHKPYCQNCGAKLTPDTPANPTPAPAASYPMSGVRGMLKALAESPVYMTAMIAFTLSLVLSFLASVSGSNVFSSLLYTVMYTLDLEDYINEAAQYLSALNGADALSTIVSMAPDILLCVGMWLMFLSAKKGQPTTTGLTIIKVIVVIQLVLACLALAALEFVFIMMLASGYAGDSGAGIFAVIMLLVALFFGLGILYQAKVLKTIGIMKYSIVNDTVLSSVSSYVIFVCWVTGIFSGISSLFAGVFTLILSGVAGAVSSVAFGLFLSRYKKEMRGFRQSADSAEITE